VWRFDFILGSVISWSVVMKIKIYLDFISFNPSFGRLSSSVKSQKLSEKLILWKKRFPRYSTEISYHRFLISLLELFTRFEKKSFWIKLKISHSQRTNGQPGQPFNCKKTFHWKGPPSSWKLESTRKRFFLFEPKTNDVAFFYFTQSWLSFSFLKIETPFSLSIVE